MHFLWICRRLGQKPAEFANIVRKLKQNDSIEVGKHKVIPLLIKNTPDGRLYILDLYEDGKLIRRSPCFLDQPRRGRNVRMVAEIVGIMLLVGLSITGAAIAYFFGSGLADTLMTQESCEILRFDVFDVDESNIYYVMEVQNTGTWSKEFFMHMKVEDEMWEPDIGPENIAEFGSHAWSDTVVFGSPVSKKSDYLVEVFSTDGNTFCTAQTTSK